VLAFQDFSWDLIQATFDAPVPRRARAGVRASVAYLHSYLEQQRAVGVVVEEHYIDRHYVEDYAAWYARSFRPPDASCQRLHFFKELKGEALQHAFRSACDSGAAAELTEQLQGHYLGFVVKRPLRLAQIGRSVLSTYPPEQGRLYSVVRPYTVHLAGLRLSVDGLAFQEQDGGTAVCASTALWSALQRVAYVAGNRTPSPSSITAAAESPFPHGVGLRMEQMARAFSNLGYVAEWFTPDGNRPLFRARVAACLRSHLPVILILRDESRNGGHAVTLTGYNLPPEPAYVQLVPEMERADPETAGEAPASPQNGVLMRSAGLTTVYVHDDNLGAHAHYEFRDSQEVDDNGHAKLNLFRGDPKRAEDGWWTPDELTVAGALVPKATKMRLPLESLIYEVHSLQHLFSDVLFYDRRLQFDTYLTRGVDYRQKLWTMQLDPAGLERLQTTLSLPRHAVVIEIHDHERHLVDVLLDVTEVAREATDPAILAIVAPAVPAQSILGKWLRKTAEDFSCSVAMAR
jgi:hypothetical protein